MLPFFSNGMKLNQKIIFIKQKISKGKKVKTKSLMQIFDTHINNLSGLFIKINMSYCC